MSAAFTLDLRPLLRNRALMAYVLAFAGNIWVVSAIRAWFVAYLAWNLGQPHQHLEVPSPAVISGLASLAGTAAGRSIVILPLPVVAQVASLADASALTAGAVAAADPARRGAALALFAFVGYTAAFIGPVAGRVCPRRVRRRRPCDRLGVPPS